MLINVMKKTVTSRNNSNRLSYWLSYGADERSKIFDVLAVNNVARYSHVTSEVPIFIWSKSLFHLA